MSEQVELIAPTLAALLFSTVILIPLMLLILGHLFIKVVSIRKEVLYTIIGLLSVVGSYVASFSTFQIMIALAIGVLAYHLRKRNFPIITLLLGFILGPSLEEFLCRSLTLSQGDPPTFLTNPDSLFFILLTLVSIYFLAIRNSLAAPDATQKE